MTIAEELDSDETGTCNKAFVDSRYQYMFDLCTCTKIRLLNALLLYHACLYRTISRLMFRPKITTLRARHCKKDCHLPVYPSEWNGTFHMSPTYDKTTHAHICTIILYRKQMHWDKPRTQNNTGSEDKQINGHLLSAENNLCS